MYLDIQTLNWTDSLLQTKLYIRSTGISVSRSMCLALMEKKKSHTTVATSNDTGDDCQNEQTGEKYDFHY